jgi:hypothetical protein
VGSAKLAQRPVELLAQLSKSGLRRCRPRRHHEIQIAGDLVQRRIKDLPEPSPDGIARHRVSHPPADGESQARRTELVGKSVHGEQLAPVSGALPINPFKLRRVGQSCPLAPRQRSDGQPFPSAPAPGGDDPAPTDRAHALAKAVRFSPFSTIRLISTLHQNSSTDTVNFANNPQSISEARRAIQRWGARKRRTHKGFSKTSPRRKCCKTRAKPHVPSTDWRSPARVTRASLLFQPPVATVFSTDCPQPVDNHVDKHVNTLQKCVLFPNAIALCRGVR